MAQLDNPDNNAKPYERVWYTPYGQARHHWGQDFDGDRDFDSADVNALLNKISGGSVPITDTANYDAEYDLNRDGTIDFNDLPSGSAQTAVPLGQLGRLDGVNAGPDNWIGYAGYVWEGASSLYHVRHRSYSPELGRWMQRDPAGYVDGMGLYEYGRSASPLWTDPFGLQSRRQETCECDDGWDDGLDDIRESLRRVEGDPDHNIDWTDEEREFFRRYNEEVDEKTARYMKAGLGGFLFVAGFFVPGDELIWGPLLLHKGWKLARGGRTVVDAAGRQVSRRQLKVAIARARQDFERFDDDVKRLINESLEKFRGQRKTCSTKDGREFENWIDQETGSRLLPELPTGQKYIEYHPGFGRQHKESWRVIIGPDGTMWVWDHQKRMIKVIVPGPSGGPG
ncbi:MAG: RHS repeat-associated core domain-containing protein [Phycisphaerales bacterium]